MPRLPEYDAPQRELTPSDKGAAAFEQAGRRIGPAYNEAATLTREKGAVASDLIKQRRWPFDAQELYRTLDDIERAKAKTATSGVGFKVEGLGGSGGSGVQRGGILDDSGGSHSGGKGHNSHTGADVGGMSIAAAGLGRLAGAMARGNQYRNSIIDPVSGLDLSLPQNQPKGYTALEHGQIVHYGANGQRLTPKSKDSFTGPNADAARAAQGDATGQWSPALDWDSPANKTKRLKEYERTGVDPVTGQMQPPPGTLPGSYSNGGGVNSTTGGMDRYGEVPPPPIPGPFKGGQYPDGRTEDLNRRYDQGYSPTNQTETPWDRLSPSGADEARGAVEDMRNQYDRSGAYTDTYAPSDSGASGGGSDDTTYDEGSGDY